jgi:AbrB family looped-hinge helix DNA binding protein
MDIASVSANGQVTVPVAVRRELKLIAGDKVAFVKNEVGDIVLVKPLAAALIDAQRAFAGAAVEADVQSEAAVDLMVAEVRAERRARRP